MQGTWSRFKQGEYDSIMQQLGKERGFLWELENWEIFSEKFSQSQSDKGSYIVFCNEHKEQANNIYLWPEGNKKKL